MDAGRAGGGPWWGRKGGHRPKLEARKRALAAELYRGKKHSVGEICRALGIRSRTTFYKAIAEEEKEGAGKASGVAWDASAAGRAAAA